MVQGNHPKLAMAYNTFGKHLLLNSSPPVRLRALVVLRVSQHYNKHQIMDMVFTSGNYVMLSWALGAFGV